MTTEESPLRGIDWDDEIDFNLMVALMTTLPVLPEVRRPDDAMGPSAEDAA